jgi:hypothetical protein
MARYPDDPAPQGNPSVPYPFTPEWPIVSGGPSWAQKTRALTRGDLLSTDLSYAGLSWAQVMILYSFWKSVGGANGTFSFADFNGFEKGNSAGPGVPWQKLFIAKGDGIAQAWTLPTFILQCHVTDGLIDNVVVRVAGVAKPNLSLHPDTGGTDGYIQQGAGTDGFDYLHLAAVPAASAILDMDGTCRRGARIARITTTKFPFSLRNPANYQGGVISIMEQVG